MRNERSSRFMFVLPLLIAVLGAAPFDSEAPAGARRKDAEQRFADGNYAEAYSLYRGLLLNAGEDPLQAGPDLDQAVACLQRLNRRTETDELREQAIRLHAANWRLLLRTALSVFGEQHDGFIIAGEFERGPHRGGGRYANAHERDRVRALQIMTEALEVSRNEPDKAAVAEAHLQYARVLMGYRGYQDAWRLQDLTDLTELPDYDEGYHYYARGGSTRGAPVHPDGTPVYHALPDSYAAAQSDGERWRWLLERARELDPKQTNRVMMNFANFLHQQFGVQTLSNFTPYFRAPVEPERGKDESGIYELHTLGENETIARLATGIKRLALPDEFNFVHIYRHVADHPDTGSGEGALNTLAQIFENRRQFDPAAKAWKRSIEEYGDNKSEWKQKKVDQILLNWGRFDNASVQPAGRGATIEYVFRNGSRVAFEAHRIAVETLLEDVMAYLRANPARTDWNKMDIARIGYRIVRNNESKYIGEVAAKWELDLAPRDNHFDKRVTVKTPLDKPGAYLLTARMQDGNTSKIVLWLADTSIVRKNLDKQTYFFVADAVSGEPLPGVNLQFFGYRQEATKRNGGNTRRYNVQTSHFAEISDANGQVLPARDDFANPYQWLVIATAGDRLAYLGFTHAWYGEYHDAEYKQQKVYTITDRPVYRPNQVVNFKFWVRNAQYDRDETSSFAGKSFTVNIVTPQNEKVLEQTLTADAYSGFNGDYLLPDDAPLGVYRLHIPNIGGGSFRVEEYKKPEFKVSIDAPAEPIALGETVKATLRATYYFGAPVTKARVKYTVRRSNYSDSWYPVGPWDWLYGPGYWWFAYDYDWYPGWTHWGCLRPRGWWWPAAPIPPEIVAEAEVDIGEDGTVEIEIDTAPAGELHGNTDHRYEITAEVTDESRRTIVGSGAVLAARKPFKVYAWVDRGHYRVGDVVRADVHAQALDGKPIQGTGELKLLKIGYRARASGNGPEGITPVETPVQTWSLDTDDEGSAHVQIKASEAGQYRLSYTLTDSKNRKMEGGHVFVVRGDGSDGSDFRFNDIELVPDNKQYKPGETVRLAINTDRPNSTVVLFVRPANGVYLKPKVLRLRGKSAIEEIEITRKDMPNFFVEAFTIRDGKLHSETREILVPPEKRVLNVEVQPSAEQYDPGQEARVLIRITDFDGQPLQGSVVVSVYDESVDYIAGGSNVPEIREFFWKWRRHHQPRTESSLDRRFANIVPPGAETMGYIGVFGYRIADDGEALGLGKNAILRKSVAPRRSRGMALGDTVFEASAMPMAASAGLAMDSLQEKEGGAGGDAPGPEVEPAIRKEFADTAFWAAALETDANGEATVVFNMPENLTGWRIRTWAMGHGTRVGEGEANAVTTKNLLLRLQAPRFFVEKDEAVLSANIHNALATDKQVRAVLELEGGCLEILPAADGDEASAGSTTVTVPANGETRVDWRVKVTTEGEAVVRMKALTDEESDAMEMRFPVRVHGMLKTESFCGVIRAGEQPGEANTTIAITVPVERRVEQSRLEIRYSPTLAGALVDALPYLVSYPYGCTEQTLNRFVPTVITLKVLKDMGLDLGALRDKRTNLNAQEIGDDAARAAQWKRYDENPVFDEAVVADMVRKGLKRLTSMQLTDGGWGWFSGWGERSSPHTTAVVVHGLQTAQANGAGIVPRVLEHGVQWLVEHQAQQVRLLKNAESETRPWKSSADSTDALVYMVLVDAGREDADMREFLYRDRARLAVYAKAMFGMALHTGGHAEKRDMLIRNIEQYLVQDAENQAAWLNLPNGGYWWYWYGSENEAHAYYLKLLAATDPHSEKAAGLVKYLLNNRKHATYWKSTRDTALCIEAMADYLRASGEDQPDMTVEIYMDGRKLKDTRITAENLFAFDNRLVLEGNAVPSGTHDIEIRRTGRGPVYFNAYLSTFTLEDFITRAGLEVKVNRTVYRLRPVDKALKLRGDRGQVLTGKDRKFEREPLEDLAMLKSGELVEIELTIESKNDYEYLVFEDMKAAGFEPVEVRSGYNANDLGAYMELRDEKVCFFVRALARGKHSVSYRLRAEIPGRFSALPTRAYAMYAPELKANSDEIRLQIED